jgi:hypothetical protein
LSTSHKSVKHDLFVKRGSLAMKLWGIVFIICLFSALFSISNRITPVRATSLVTLLPIADAYVDSEHNTSNYGGADYLYAQFWDYTYIADVRENIYLMFNLTRFSPSYEVSSASLRLYAWSAWSPTAHVGVHQCSDTTWDEIAINWLNAPSFSPSASDVVAVPFEDTWYSWNVTSLVNNALGSRLTLMLAVEDIGESYTTGFYSKEGWQNNPELVIEFKDGDPPTYASFHMSKDFVKTGEDFIVSVDLYDPSGISKAQALFLDEHQNDQGNVTLEGSGANGTYSKTMHFKATTTDGNYSVKIYAMDGVGNDGQTDILGTIAVDTNPPNISNTSQIPLKENVQPSDIVKVNVTVTDFISGVKQVFINYTINSGEYFTANMTLIEGNIYTASIPQSPYRTNVTYMIVAEDNCNNNITTQELGFDYGYSVVPEIAPFMILPLFMIATLLMVTVSKSTCKTNKRPA